MKKLLSFLIFAQLYTYARFFPPHFSFHFGGFLFWYFYRFLLFSLFLHENEGLHCSVLELRHLFLWSSGQSVKKKEIAKLLKTSERRPNKWSKSKTLEDKPRSRWPFFHKMFEKYCRKSCKYMRDISTKQKVKKISTSHYRWKFWAQRYGDKLPKKVGKPWREKSGAHFMQAWCQRDLPTLYQRRTSRQTHMMWTP